jgi:CubicO group peptidase (beta-lactamase class C family)
MMASSLDDFDKYVQTILEDWNAPGIGVAVVQGSEVIFAKGYGYRDYEQKLPFTASTLMPIASNTKIFTAVAAGLLVHDGKLSFDKPIREYVPSIRFASTFLTENVTLRDMLSHRTGLPRYDMIRWKSAFTPKELFERIQFMEPVEPLRQTYLYNNMMYEAVGYIIELISGKSWAQFVQDRIVTPLGMRDTVFAIPEMLERSDIAIPFTKKRDSEDLHKIPYSQDKKGSNPAGGIISSLDDMSRWLVATMNGGMLAGDQIIPASVLKATLEPAIPMTNAAAESLGFWEVLKMSYGMGRNINSYRGYLHTDHGGDHPGFHSQVSYLPNERIGVAVFVIGDHCTPLRDTIGYAVYERLLGLSLTPWSERWREFMSKAEQEARTARSNTALGQAQNTRPSHNLADYVGSYENPAYGALSVHHREDKLEFDFRDALLPLDHFHYDRFDTPDDELHGKWSVNFLTNPQGHIDKAVMSLDQAEAIFVRMPERVSPELLEELTGIYQTASGLKFQVVLDEASMLWLEFPGQPKEKLVPYQGLQFRVEKFSDFMAEFVREDNRITSLRYVSPHGEFIFARA